MRTYLGDVGEVLPSCVGECTVHVLLQPRLDEEEGLEPLGMADRLLLQQLKGIPLIISPDYDLLDHSQDSDFESVPRDCGR